MKIEEALENIKLNDANTFVSLTKLENNKTGVLSDYCFSLKDVFAVKGQLTTAGSKILHNYLPSYNSTVFELLINAGAKYIGKNSLDEFAAGEGQHSLVKIINNSNGSYACGGSSSGSGSAVAGNEVDFSIGSDTGGSVRHPAYFCNVYGFKPSQRQISRFGLIGMSDPLDSVGIMAKDLDLISKVYTVLNVKDEKDYRNVPLNYSNINDIKYIVVDEVDPELLSKIPMQYSTFTFDFDKIYPLYRRIMLPYFYSNLNKYDGVKFNKKFTASFNNELNICNRTNLLNDESKYRIYSGFNLVHEFKDLQLLKTPFNNVEDNIYIMQLNDRNIDHLLPIANIYDFCALYIPFSYKYGLHLLAKPGLEKQLLEFAKLLK